MNDTSLKKAESEAKRFLKAASDWRAATKGDAYPFLCGCKESGALRRCSMDLTRALADLRRPA
mgnify:CR=1 FL=1